MINETYFFYNINKINKKLARLTKKKRKQTQTKLERKEESLELIAHKKKDYKMLL